MVKADTGKKPRKKTIDKEQAERFKETARELGVDESGKNFEDAFGKIVPTRKASPKEPS
jgi:hypothetical protein